MGRRLSGTEPDAPHTAAPALRQQAPPLRPQAPALSPQAPPLRPQAPALHPEALAEGRVQISGLEVNGTEIWWLEGRPLQGGRQVLMKKDGSKSPIEVTDEKVSVRSKVHEYGGGAFHVDDVGSVVFTDLEDQALWLLRSDGSLDKVTPAAPVGEVHRYADARSVSGTDWWVAVRERHLAASVDHQIVALRVCPGEAMQVMVIEAGRSFYSAPRPSPDGRQLAFLAWDHPQMPWDGSELTVADILFIDVEGGGSEPRLGHKTVLGGATDESVGQPRWSDEGDLWFICDRYDWWQPYKAIRGKDPVRVCDAEVEFHSPDWVLGQHTFDVISDGSLVARYRQKGRDRVGIVDPETGILREIEQPCVSISALQVQRTSESDREDGAGGPLAEQIVISGLTPTDPAAIYRLDMAGGVEAVHRPVVNIIDPSDVSVGEALELRGRFGPLYLLYYPPAAQNGATAPPLMVMCHGGPTASAEAGLDLNVQLWTSRGFAVAAVDYRGSSGHGRSFRRALDGMWGVADAEDVIEAASALAQRGLADPQQMFVRGGSAGGFTALVASEGTTPFKAALVLYGVTDLKALATDTHDFESRYLDGLVGPWPAAESVYEERSPANHPEQIHCSVLLLQGADDPIVPPAQALAMVAALRRSGVQCEHRVFDGEGHGFRRAETLVECARIELAFVGEMTGLELI